MNNYDTHNQRIAEMTVACIYPMYLTKVEKKGRTKEELDQVIEWLTGFDNKKLQELINENVTFETFFQQATLNPNAFLITGSICGVRIEEIENRLTQQVRYLDKLVDELAKGRKMEKILRGVQCVGLFKKTDKPDGDDNLSPTFATKENWLSIFKAGKDYFYIFVKIRTRIYIWIITEFRNKMEFIFSLLLQLLV